ncbi:putative lipid II flippase FtsW [Isoalcanivorax beigongshangi]|uniref:Probable peptidoglycan glycosyltransferase FtsW n=1 Tax=Isoalcanivorax beigongshangi TaxID=3238810 RepID=A0ABV4AIF8_9GAMM
MRADAQLLRPQPRQIDMPLLCAVLALALLGFVMVSSASLQIAETRLGSPFHYALRHGFYLAAAALTGVLVYLLVPVDRLEKVRVFALPCAVFVLLLVFIPGLGRSVNGSLRWIALPGMTVQTSEIAKICFVVYLAGYVSLRRQELLGTWKGFLIPLGVLGAMALLLLAQPDFGATVVMGTACMGMLFLAGVPARRFFLLAGGVLALGALIAVAQPYRVARLMSFLDPWADQYGSGYQLTQSLIAFGRGHWFGVGLGNSVQKLFYLPEAHTDFVYAVMAEELGLLGNLTMMALFALVIYRVFRIGGRLEHRGWFFQAQVVYGIGFIVATQALINLGVNMGVLPTKGLTLPFISYGGSSLLVSAAMVALVLRAGSDLQRYEGRERGRMRA